LKYDYYDLVYFFKYKVTKSCKYMTSHSWGIKT